MSGKVLGIRFLENVKDQPTFLILVGLSRTSNQLLTAVIWGDMRKTFEKAPEEMFKDKEICVVGKVELFRERPQIVLSERGQVSEGE